MKPLKIVTLVFVVLVCLTTVSAQDNFNIAETVSPQQIADLVGEHMYFNISYGLEVHEVYYLKDPNQLYGRDGHIFILYTSEGLMVHRIFGDPTETYYTAGIMHIGKYDFDEVKWVIREDQYIFALAIEDGKAWMVIVSLNGCSPDFCPYGPSGFMVVRDSRQLGLEDVDLAEFEPYYLDGELLLKSGKSDSLRINVYTDDELLIEVRLKYS